jgi:hypothetical protein
MISPETRNRETSSRHLQMEKTPMLEAAKRKRRKESEQKTSYIDTNSNN